MQSDIGWYSPTHCIHFVQGWKSRPEIFLSKYFNHTYLCNEREIWKTESCPMILLLIRIQQGIKEPLELKFYFEDLDNVTKSL